MTIFIERDLQISIPGEFHARKFDDPQSHQLTHCMKGVDFIVELPDKYLFIEFKDPQHPQTAPKDAEEYRERLQSGGIDEELKYKYRDSFLYEWASGRADKPIDYLVLIAWDILLDRDLNNRTAALNQKLPLLGPGGANWPRPIAASCNVFNLDSWNRNLPNYPVVRLSENS